MEDQSYQSHTKWFPPYHFVAVPILTVNVGVQVMRAAKAGWTGDLIWNAIAAFGILVGVAIARVMALRVQDRLIRLEMRLRFANILPAALQARAADLLPGQLVALRFASDAELPSLVERTLSGEFAKPTDIKKAIHSWVGDYLRV